MVDWVDLLQVNWHDLAFFDPILYESLRQLVADAQSGVDDVIEALDLTYVVDLQNEEGGGQVSGVVIGACAEDAASVFDVDEL